MYCKNSHLGHLDCIHVHVHVHQERIRFIMRCWYMYMHASTSNTAHPRQSLVHACKLTCCLLDLATVLWNLSLAPSLLEYVFHNQCTCTPTCTCIHVYMYVHVCTHICILLLVLSHMYLDNLLLTLGTHVQRGLQ